MAHRVEEGFALAETAACNVEVCGDIGFLLKSTSWGIIVHLQPEKKYITLMNRFWPDSNFIDYWMAAIEHVSTSIWWNLLFIARLRVVVYLLALCSFCQY